MRLSSPDSTEDMVTLRTCQTLKINPSVKDEEPSNQSRSPLGRKPWIIGQRALKVPSVPCSRHLFSGDVGSQEADKHSRTTDVCLHPRRTNPSIAADVCTLLPINLLCLERSISILNSDWGSDPSWPNRFREESGPATSCRCQLHVCQAMSHTGLSSEWTARDAFLQLRSGRSRTHAKDQHFVPQASEVHGRGIW